MLKKLRIPFVVVVTSAALLLGPEHVAPAVAFALAGLGLVLWGQVMSEASEQVAHHLGPLASGLVNATFGNASELTVGLMALSRGHVAVVQGAIVGSVLTNLLLILGVAAFLGGLTHKYQRFNRASAAVTLSTMALAVIAFLTPATLGHISSGKPSSSLALVLDEFSIGAAVLLMGLYAMSLVFSLVTHKDVFRQTEPEARATWGLGRAVGTMLGATLVIVLMSDALVDALDILLTTTRALSPSFLGVIVLAAFGNAADLTVAIQLARKDRIDLVFQVVGGAATQVALFVAPLFVLAGEIFGHPLTLLFDHLSTLAVAVSTVALGVCCSDGEFTWFKGVQLLGVYIILAVAFFFY